MTKVIIVGPEDVYQYFEAVWTEWDTQHPVASINQMWDELGTNVLSPESEIVIFNETDLSDTNDDLALAIATFAPEALVMVVSYDAANQPLVRQRVDSAIQASESLRPAPFYFINTWEETLVDDTNAHIANYRRALAERYRASQVNASRSPIPAGVESMEVGFEDDAPREGSQGPAPTGSAATRTADHAGAESLHGHSVVKNRGDTESLGLVVSSTSSKGGSGKTTVGMCFASMLAHSSRIAAEQGLVSENGTPARQLKVVIVDMDTRDGQIGFNINKLTPTALNIFISPNKDLETIKENLIYDERLGVHALLAPKRARTADHLTPEFYEEVIYQLRTIFDVVVLDTSVFYLDALLGQLVLPVSDAIMFVTDLSLGSVFGMVRWMDEITGPLSDGGYDIPKEKIGIVVNKTLPNVGIDQELLKKTAGDARLLVAIPMDSEAVLSAANNSSLADIILEHPYVSPAYYKLAKKVWNAWRDEPLAPPVGDDPSIGRKAKPSGAPTAEPVSARNRNTAKTKRRLFSK